MSDQAVENTQDQPTIQLVDLANALRIIDVAAERGAFKGNELSSVGAVRDKIATFLNAVAPQPEEGAEEAAEEAPAEKKAAKKKK